MIKSIQLSGVHSKLTEEVRAYVQKKIGGLDKFIPKDARASAQVDVKIKESKSKDKQLFECEIIVKLPKANLAVHEKSTTALSAIDIAEDNLKNQLKKYKEKHSGPRIHRRILRRINRRG